MVPDNGREAPDKSRLPESKSEGAAIPSRVGAVGDHRHLTQPDDSFRLSLKVEENGGDLSNELVGVRQRRCYGEVMVG